MGTGVADGGLQGQGGCLACRQCSRHWGRGQTLSRRYHWGMSRSRPGRTRGPIAQRDDPCKEPGSRAKLCSGTRCGSPPARVLFSASPRDISQPPPQALFSPAWEGVVVPPFPPPLLGSELRLYFRLVSAWRGRMASLFCSSPPPPHTHTRTLLLVSEPFHKPEGRQPYLWKFETQRAERKHQGRRPILVLSMT